MKPEPLAKLNKEAAKYPTTFEYVISDLKAHNNILDLKYNTILHLYSYEIVKNLNFTTISNLFND